MSAPGPFWTIGLLNILIEAKDILSSELKLGDGEGMLTQVIEKDYRHCDTLSKHTPVYSEKHTVLLSILINGFENSFLEC